MDSLWSALAGAVATGLLGALAFLFKTFVLEPRSRLREAQQQRVRALQELRNLLAMSFDTFKNQNFKARSLLA
jgi:uncharacterized membrane protein